MPTPLSDSHAAQFQHQLGYTFSDPQLLVLALTHPSCAQEHATGPTNQRLEFLGDSVLGFILADALYRGRPADREGALTKARSALAQGRQLAAMARELGVPEALRVSDAERDQGGHLRAAALEDALEAIIGAIYLDGGIEAARRCVLHWLGNIDQLLESAQRRTNAKGRLQELLQGSGQPTPEYRLTHTEGPDHDRTYSVEAWFQGRRQGQGRGSSIKAAEEAAAEEAIDAFAPQQSPLPQ